MIHHSCDRCKKIIDQDQEVRFVVNVEIQVAVELDELGMDEESHLKELESIMEGLDRSECDEIRDHAYQYRQYDLCSDCRNEYAKNPFSLERPLEFGFSDN